MKCYCPACDGPNEVNPEIQASTGNAKIRCTWCGTEFTPSPQPETPSAAAAYTDKKKKNA